MHQKSDHDRLAELERKVEALCRSHSISLDVQSTLIREVETLRGLAELRVEIALAHYEATLMRQEKGRLHS